MADDADPERPRPGGEPHRPTPGLPSADASGARDLVPSPWRSLAVGLLAGAISGLYGVGGGIVIVPLLVLLAGFDQRRAHATSLAAIGIIAVSGTTGYGLAGEVDWAVAALMALGSVAGAVAGTHLLRTLPQRQLQLAFAVLLVVTAVRLAVGDVAEGAGFDLHPLSALGIVALGLAVGVLAGVLGVGGGILSVPVLTLVAGMALVVAKGTSLAVIVPTALVGTLRNRSAGSVESRSAVLVGVGGVVSAFVAARVSLGLDPAVSSWLFAGLLVIVGIRMLRQGLRSGST